MERIWSGVKKEASILRSPTKKATELPVEVLKLVLAREVWDKRVQVQNIPLLTFRSCIWIMVQYFTLSRLQDLIKLTASDFKLCVDSDGRKYIDITFPSSKSDQFFKGSHAFIPAARSRDTLCPVEILRCYFSRSGLRFGNSKNPTPVPFLPVVRRVSRKQIRTSIADGRKAVSTTTLLDHTRDLLRKHGYTRKFTTKSAKVSGVNAGFRNKLTELEVQRLGRWMNPFTAFHYRTDFEEDRRNLVEVLQF